jgi:hypothetical protein
MVVVPLRDTNHVPEQLADPDNILRPHVACHSGLKLPPPCFKRLSFLNYRINAERPAKDGERGGGGDGLAAPDEEFDPSLNNL